MKLYNDEVLEESKNDKYVKQITDIADEEGLKNTYEAKDGLYQHYIKLLIADTRDFPRDHR